MGIRDRTMEERLIEENLKILSINHPSLAERLRSYKGDAAVEVIKAKSKDYTCRFKGLILHSLYDPKREATRLIKGIDCKARVIFVLGFGFGYHLQRLIKEISGRTKIVVIDPSLSLFKEAIRHIDLDFLKTPMASQVEFLVGVRIRDIISYIRKELAPLEIRSNEITLLRHHSSVRLYPSYYNEAIKVILQSLERRERIAIISPSDYDEQDPSNRPLWADYWVKHELTDAFTKMGYLVTDEEPEITIHLFGSPVWGLPKDTYNIIWIYSHPDLITPFILRNYDKIFCLSSRFAKKIKEMGFEADVMIGATSKRPVEKEILYDVILVGNSKYKGHIRQMVVSELITNTQHRFKVFGSGWRLPKDHYGGRYIDYRGIENLYASSLICLNDHHEDMKREGFVSLRIFDVLASGGFVISDKNPGIEEIFGNSVPQYESVTHLRELIDFYINNPDERRGLMEKGKEIALSHTWRKRAEQFLEGLEVARLRENKWIIPSWGKKTRKIFYIDHFSPENSNLLWLKEFRRFGNVEAFDIKIEDKRDLLSRITNFRPDHLHLGGSVKNEWALVDLLSELKKNLGFKVSQFYGDTYYPLHHQDKTPRLTDYVYITNKTHIRLYKERGFNNFRYMPCPTDPEIFNYQRCEKIYDLVFIGNNYSPSRLNVLKKISALFDLMVFGEGWEGTSLNSGPQVWNHDFSRTCNRAKIVLGLIDEKIKDLEAYFSNRLTNTLATRSLLIQTYTPGLDGIFTNRKYLLWYMDEDELFDLIDYYLRMEDERERIALLGQREVYEKYTYKKSIERILNECEEGVSYEGLNGGKFDQHWQRAIIEAEIGKGRYTMEWYIAHPITKELLKSGVLKGKVLDLGCGTGQRAFLAKEKSGCKIIGIDLSSYAIGYAQNNYGSSRLRFICGNLLRLPFKKDTFDNAYMLGVIEHLVDTKTLLHEIRRVVKKGGRLFLSVTENDYHGDPTHVHSFTIDSLKGSLKGFRVLNIYTKEHIIFVTIEPL